MLTTRTDFVRCVGLPYSFGFSSGWAYDTFLCRSVRDYPMLMENSLIFMGLSSAMKSSLLLSCKEDASGYGFNHYKFGDPLM